MRLLRSRDVFVGWYVIDMQSLRDCRVVCFLGDHVIDMKCFGDCFGGVFFG